MTQARVCVLDFSTQTDLTFDKQIFDEIVIIRDERDKTLFRRHLCDAAVS
jgi:hypothetical protein